MDIFDQILEHLELERELGARTVEFDRALLVPPKPPVAPERVPPASEGSPRNAKPRGTETSLPAAVCDILFLSGRPLSAAGTEAIHKTIAAMRKIKGDISVRLNEDVQAKIIILLGSDALKKLQPGTGRSIRGRWMTVNGVPTLPTFSPDYIFTHFQEGSSSRTAATRDMWSDVKSAIARL